MTWRDVINIQVGQNNRNKAEHERVILEHRVLSEYLINAFGMVKNPKSFDKIYPISIDKQKDKKEISYSMPLESFHKILQGIYGNE